MKGSISIEGRTLTLHTVNTLIIGSGAAALNAAICLHEYGQRDLLIATDRWGGGTSNNSGSDKQTYYKLSLAGDEPDSPLDMARDLFSGGCMHGDIALCEANHSAEAFFNLVRLGVPFPRSRHGAFPGYKTDHDARGRGTSAGPRTSRMMVAALASRVRELNIPVLDGHQVISLLTAGDDGEKTVIGAVALDGSRLGDADRGLTVFNAVNVILATGGPAGIYAASVYPESQTGSHGLAFQAGAAGQNLTESQFGIASVAFRWNLSGTYQQVMPRYVSRDREGRDERSFLQDHFPDTRALCEAIFLKGYQWPFDPRKIANHGSSLIDLLVYRETVINGRHVFLDFSRNPADDFTLDSLGPLPREYLTRSSALLDTPVERLAAMNQPAIDLYRDNGIDLYRDLLEIAVCAQHNNGGLKADIWWESSLSHLFPVGEICGTHGVYRPGGSALNSGQVGGRRAALRIARAYRDRAPDAGAFLARSEKRLHEIIMTMERMLAPGPAQGTGHWTLRKRLQERMTAAAAHIRTPETVKKALGEARREWRSLPGAIRIANPADLPEAFRTMDLCLTHLVYLEAIAGYLSRGGESRGSYLVTGDNPAKPPESWAWRLAGPGDFVSSRIQETVLDSGGKIRTAWSEIRPLPAEDLWFETVYNTYTRTGTIT
ncbi:FAD-binding protein [bacterium]|nr:FAD-binding protein [bacterium]